MMNFKPRTQNALSLLSKLSRKSLNDLSEWNNTDEKLMKYVEDSALKSIASLLQKKKISSTKLDPQGHSALHVAAMRNKYDVVQLLIAYGAKVTAVDYQGRTALHCAAHHGACEALKVLQHCYDEEWPRDNRKMTALHHACIGGNLDCVLDLIRGFPEEIDAADEVGRAPLYYAAQVGHYHVCAELLDRGAAVNTQDIYGGTALMTAAENGNHEICKLLMSKGAKTDAVDSLGHDALWHALEAGHNAIKDVIDPSHEPTDKQASFQEREHLPIPEENELDERYTPTELYNDEEDDGVTSSNENSSVISEDLPEIDVSYEDRTASITVPPILRKSSDILSEASVDDMKEMFRTNGNHSKDSLQNDLTDSDEEDCKDSEMLDLPSKPVRDDLFQHRVHTSHNATQDASLIQSYTNNFSLKCSAGNYINLSKESGLLHSEQSNAETHVRHSAESLCEEASLNHSTTKHDESVFQESIFLFGKEDMKPVAKVSAQPRRTSIQADEEVSNLRKEIEQLKQDKEALLRMIDTKNEEIIKALRAHDGELSDLNNQITSKNKEITQLTSEMSAIKIHIAKYKERSIVITGQNNSYKKDVEKLSKKAELYEAEYKKLKERFKQKEANERRMLKHHRALTQKLDESSLKVKELQQSLLASPEFYNPDNTDLAEKLEGMENEIYLLRERCSDQSMEIEKVTEMSQFNEELLHLKTIEVESLEKQISLMRDNSYPSTSDKSKRTVLALQDQVCKLQNQLSDTAERYQETIEIYRNNLILAIRNQLSPDVKEALHHIMQLRNELEC